MVDEFELGRRPTQDTSLGKSSMSLPAPPGQHLCVFQEKSPAKYAARIQEFASRSPHDYIYSGYNYRQLAGFLNRPTPKRANVYHPRRSSGLIDNDVPNYVYTVPAGDGKKASNSSSSSSSSRNSYGCFDHESFTASPPPAPQVGGQIVWLQGFPTPEWINAVGAQYRIDPEFFRRFLVFLSNRDSYDIPSAASAPDATLTICLTTVCQRTMALSQQEIETARSEAADSVRQHLQKLNLDSCYGDSIVRRYRVLDNTTFVVEQDIMLHLKDRGHQRWLALVCCDAGRDLAHRPEAPWVNDKSNSPPTCQPIIVYSPKMALMLGPSTSGTENVSGPSEPAAVDNKPTKKMPQSVSLLARHFDPVNGHEANWSDLRNVINEILNFGIASESQFLNRIGSMINFEQQRKATGKQMSWSLATMKYFKEATDDHIRNIDSVIESLGRSEFKLAWAQGSTAGTADDYTTNDASSQDGGIDGATLLSVPITKTRSREDRGGSPKRHNSNTGSTTPSLANRIADYISLRNRAVALSQRCTENVAILTNTAMLEESKRAIVQADGLRRLTLLAFFFLPASLTTSFFGQNFVEFGQGRLSVWVCFVTAVPVLALSSLLCFWDEFCEQWQKLRG